ncbi:hypothetical protein C8R43DRAFT_949212 [Mycena crocata]|nr:hypothetical protein C8R43DRAFT_949212 [Mycena crocata]
MSSSNQQQNNLSSSSPLYRWAVLAAVFLFAAVFATVYFRSRMERRRRLLLGADGRRLPVVDPTKKPPLFDAYIGVGDPPGPMSRDWEEMMPLSAASCGAHTPNTPKSNSKRASTELHARAQAPSLSIDPDFFDPARVQLSVVVRMPFSTAAIPPPDPDDDDAPLPHLEIGLTEVDVLRGAGKL